MRSIGNSVAMVTNWLFVYVVVLMTPSGKRSTTLPSDSSPRRLTKVAIANIGWRFYIIFAVLNFAWFPIVWYFYIETKGLSLEEVDLMFKIKHNAGSKMSYKEAAVLAKQEANIVRAIGTEEKPITEKMDAKVDNTDLR